MILSNHRFLRVVLLPSNRSVTGDNPLEKQSFVYLDCLKNYNIFLVKLNPVLNLFGHNKEEWDMRICNHLLLLSHLLAHTRQPCVK